MTYGPKCMCHPDDALGEIMRTRATKEFLETYQWKEMAREARGDEVNGNGSSGGGLHVEKVP